MKIITTNNIIRVETTSEQANWPVENILDEHPKKKYKPVEGVSYAKITANLSGGLDSIALFNLVANEVVVRIIDPNGVQWASGIEWETDTDWEESQPEEAYSYDKVEFEDTKAVWVEFTNISTSSINVEIQLYGDSSMQMEVGVAIAGNALDVVDDPQYGIQEGFVDYSIVKELNNGAMYYKQRDIVRTFSVRLNTSNTNTLNLLNKMARKYGRQPMAFRLTETGDSIDNNFILYGRVDNMPSATFDSYNRATNNLTIREVI